MKKLFALLMALCLMAGILSVGAFAADITPETAIANATTLTADNYKNLKAAYGTPTVDGKIDDVWATSSWYKSADGFYERAWNQPREGADIDIYFSLMWDDDNTYLIMYVTGAEGVTNEDRVDLAFNVGDTWHNAEMTNQDDVLASTGYYWGLEYPFFSENPDAARYCYVPRGLEGGSVLGCTGLEKLSDSSFVMEFCFAVNARMNSDVEYEGVGDTIPDFTEDYKNKSGDKFGFNIRFRDQDASGNKTIPSVYNDFNTDSSILARFTDDWTVVTFDAKPASSDPEPNPDTADITSLVVLLGGIALGGAVMVSKKRH